jgi:hypothetical protein
MTDRCAFRCAVEARDLGAMIDAFAGDAMLKSPVSFRPFRGRKAVGALLSVLVDVFEDFRYTDEFDGKDGSKALLFHAKIGDLELQGVDVLRFDASGLITELTVMVRPLSGLQALLGAVAPRLQALQERSVP